MIGEEHAYTNVLRNRLARLLDNRKEHRAAQEIYKDVFESVKRTNGSEHPQTLRAHLNLLMFMYKRAEALNLHYYSFLPQLSRLRYTTVRVFGSDQHPTALEFLGCNALALDRDPMAVEEAVHLKRRVLGKLTEMKGFNNTKRSAR